MGLRLVLTLPRPSSSISERLIKVRITAIFLCAIALGAKAKSSLAIMRTSPTVEIEEDDGALFAQSKPWSSSFEHVQGGARRQLRKGDGNDGKSLRLSLFHRSALELRRTSKDEFLSSEEEILEVIKADEVRLQRFRESLRSVRDRKTSDKELLDISGDEIDPELTSPAKSPSSPPAPSPSVEELQGPVVSGASLPGNHGQYLVEFYVGTPPKKFLFTVDTGSDLLWVPCSFCSRSCSVPSKGEALFFPEKSSTFSPIECSSPLCELVPPPVGGAICLAKSPTSCNYQYVYSDQSQSTGIFAMETLSFSSSSGTRLKIENVAIGCGTNNSGPSLTNMAGLIGLGQGSISFVSQAGHVFGDKFSYCFRSFFNRGRSALVFGDAVEETKLRDKLQMTPFVRNPLSATFYYVAIEAIKVAGKKLAIPSSVWAIDSNGDGGTVIDSGTTLTFFRLPAYQIIVESFKSAIAYPPAPPTAGLQICYNVSGVHKPRFPSFSVIFQNNAVFRPPPRNFFLTPTSDTSCLGILSSSGLSVLGNLLQQNFFVQYDRSSNHLGFARASCSAPIHRD